MTLEELEARIAKLEKDSHAFSDWITEIALAVSTIKKHIGLVYPPSPVQHGFPRHVPDTPPVLIEVPPLPERDRREGHEIAYEK